jgi:hypothetical protein
VGGKKRTFIARRITRVSSKQGMDRIKTCWGVAPRRGLNSIPEEPYPKLLDNIRAWSDTLRAPGQNRKLPNRAIQGTIMETKENELLREVLTHLEAQGGRDLPLAIKIRERLEPTKTGPQTPLKSPP